MVSRGWELGYFLQCSSARASLTLSLVVPLKSGTISQYLRVNWIIMDGENHAQSHTCFNPSLKSE